MVNNNIIQLNPSWESGIYSPVLLGGNPCCSIVASENPTPDQQLNCRYNSSPIQTGGDIFHTNFRTFQRLNIHGKVKDCALLKLHLQYTQ
jgi:hypothetical protein